MTTQNKPEAREAVLHACELLRTTDPAPPLPALALAVGLSPWYLQRVFKQLIGVSPRQYAAALKAGRLRGALRQGAPVMQAVYEAGYASTSRFYERADEVTGMTPTAYQAGGAGMRIRHGSALSPLGLVLVAGTERGICSVQFGNARAELEAGLRAEFPRAEILPGDADFAAWVKAVVRAIKEPAADTSVPLDVRGTAFQQRVWQALREIPPGQTATYTQIAARIARPGAARAVARACATNPAAVLIPCHRVIRGDGALAGYRWGLERKRSLLEQEAAASR